MTRAHPSRFLIPALLAVALTGAGWGQESKLASPTLTVPDAKQILWQRSLEDALVLSKAESRPLLIAVNMDGESASDRIVQELYRDPRFVAATRQCICLVSSLYRHSPRDYDDAGRRIPCPRLGEVTCGEHIALEPILHRHFLADGEKVAPRHALILQSGKKAWDLSLSFDLRDIEKQLVASLADISPSRPAAPPDAESSSRPGTVSRPEPDWVALASRRDQRGRAALEFAIARTDEIEGRRAALEAVAAHGDRGSLPALQLLGKGLIGMGPTGQQAFVDDVRALGLEAEVVDLMRRVLADPVAGDHATEPALLALAMLDGASESTRSVLLATRALSGWKDRAARPLSLAFDPSTLEAVDKAAREHRGTISLDHALDAAARITALAATAFPRRGTITDDMPPAAELEAERAKLKEQVDSPAGTPEVRARFAKVLLDLGRRRLEAKEPGATDLLREAEDSFRRALEASPEVVEWWIERARAAYFLEAYADEASFGRRAFALVTKSKSALPDETTIAAVLADPARTPDASDATGALEDSRAVEALRWIGDGEARILASGRKRSPAETIASIVDGGRALAVVAISPFSDPNDWLGFASFWGSLGLGREQLMVLRSAAMRLPAATEIRTALNTALWNSGWIELAPDEAERVCEAHPMSAEAQWFAGQALTLQAENLRRQAVPDQAISWYGRSRFRFDNAKSLRPDFRDDCLLHAAMTSFGSGMAHLMADRRSAAADALVIGVTTWPNAATVRDGLDSDVLDLIDRIFEWRESGPSDVNPRKLVERLASVDPLNPFWPLAVSDAELREALRADGRNPERTERDTVDASGRKIRMMIGLPTAEGDAYLEASIDAARAAVATKRSPETEGVLAQSLTIWAERMLLRNRPLESRRPLAEAARLLGVEAPSLVADQPMWTALAEKLRGMLGDARPKLRPGR